MSLCRDTLLDLPERSFRQVFRMNKLSFHHLVGKIENHPVFHNNSRNPQRDVWIQILVALERLGCQGNGASVGRIARSNGIGDGTVVLYTNRVMLAVLSIENEYIRLDNVLERQQTSLRMNTKYGFFGCVGVADGTHIILNQKPHTDGETYFSRKGSYSLNCQLVCDDRKLIKYYQIGWPGSVYDNQCFEETFLYTEPDRFLSPGDYLLGDSAYRLTNRMCIPYRHPQAEVPHNKLFNELFSTLTLEL